MIDLLLFSGFFGQLSIQKNELSEINLFQARLTVLSKELLISLHIKLRLMKNHKPKNLKNWNSIKHLEMLIELTAWKPVETIFKETEK